MRINMMTDYAIRALKCIYETKGVATSKLISEHEEISQGVLMKVLSRLKCGGFIESHQGRGQVTGGFSLRRPLDEITILDIVELMEGPVEMKVVNSAGNHSEHSILNKEYGRITEKIKYEMTRYTMKQIFSAEQ